MRLSAIDKCAGEERHLHKLEARFHRFTEGHAASRGRFVYVCTIFQVADVAIEVPLHVGVPQGCSLITATRQRLPSGAAGFTSKGSHSNRREYNELFNVDAMLSAPA